MTQTNTATDASPVLILPDTVVSQAREIVARRSKTGSLLEKAKGTKDSVRLKIFERVKTDYESQLRAIGEEYKPICDKILDNLKRIRTEERRLRARLEVVNEEVEELRFRCGVGEFGKDELAKREKGKLDVAADLNAKLGTIEKTYGQAKELLGTDADGVLRSGSGGGPEFADEVAIDVGANSGVLHGMAPAAAKGDPSDVTIEEPGAARASAASAVAIAEADDDLAPVGDQGTYRRAPAVTGGAAVAAVEGRAVLKLKSETGEEVFVLGDQALTIGRNPKNDIVLLDRTISRQHAKVEREGGKFFLSDMSSGGGILINGSRHKRAELKQGDEIEMGDFRFTFESK